MIAVTSASGASRPEVLVLAPGKVLRLGAMVDAIVDELRASPLDEATRAQIRRLYRDALVEVGSTLSDPLLEELAGLQSAPALGSDAELRIVVAQLAGWLHGLCEGMAAGDVPYVLTSPADP